MHPINVASAILGIELTAPADPKPPRNRLAEAYALGYRQAAILGYEGPDGGWDLLPGDGPDVPHYLAGFRAGIAARAQQPAA